jgi:hypothetical protein
MGGWRYIAHNLAAKSGVITPHSMRGVAHSKKKEYPEGCS